MARKSEVKVAARKFPPQLGRRFKIIAFDWDGTAVLSRSEDASPVRESLEMLLKLGVYVVVITGTNFPNIDRQLSAAITGPDKQRLYVSTNRGSEVYGFDAQSNPVLLWRREASPQENRLLTAIADSVRDAVVARTGLDIGVVYDRLNRRKIDLIPVSEWRDPAKSEIGRLQQAVEARLRGAGLDGGLREVFGLAETKAQQEGLTDARITSDVKHVEIGLTDKADAIDWVVRELAEKKGVPPEDILIGGDEFGPIAGFEGSDHRMVIPHSKGAVFVSVGLEPGGTPPEVIHIGGGPARFRDLLAYQVALHEQLLQPRDPFKGAADQFDLPGAPTTDPNWLLIEEGFNLAREHEIESLFAVTNGYVGTRGSLSEASSFSSPATFIAGVFDIDPLPDAIPELALAPDWVWLRIIVHGHELTLEEGELLEHRRVLDLRQGILWREWRHEDLSGRITRLRFMRLVSLADRHALVQSVLLIPENYTGRTRLESHLEQAVKDADRSLALRAESSSAPTQYSPPELYTHSQPVAVLNFRTSGRSTTVSFASASQVLAEDGRSISPDLETRQGKAVERWEWESEIGKRYRLDRLLSVYGSREVKTPAEQAIEHLEHLSSSGVERLVADHVRAWGSRWKASGIEVEGDDEVNRVLRFALYHLIGAANPEDERVSIGARALTGESYKGHVFWDTEIYILPFYTLTYPSAARALLMYRYHTLPAAREKAHGLGYRGALYAWESADTGQEATPSFALTPGGEVIPVLSGQQEHHISADIAYAVWQYWQTTGDDGFLTSAGAEIILETARFWASRGQIAEDGRYHIRRVIGPDEYHNTIDDNAYSNVMAQWNLERGEETARILQERWPDLWQELTLRLKIAPDEPREWLRLANIMYTGFDPQTGLFEQFRGYFELDEIDLAAYEPRTTPMDVLLGPARVQRSKVIKQADVVMLIYLLWDRFSPQVREANFRYYEPRTGHGSSLSPAVHALVAARLGDLPMAERYFKQAAEIDLADNMGNAAGGVHAAALGGLWQAVVFGFGGIQLRADGFAFDPHLPEHWRGLRFSAQWRSQESQVNIRAKPQEIDVKLNGQGAMAVGLVGEERSTVTSDHRLMAKWENGKWGPWREASALRC